MRSSRSEEVSDSSGWTVGGARLAPASPSWHDRSRAHLGARFGNCALALSTLALASCANMPSNVSGPDQKGQIVVALAAPAGISVSSFSVVGDVFDESGVGVGKHQFRRRGNRSVAHHRSAGRCRAIGSAWTPRPAPASTAREPAIPSISSPGQTNSLSVNLNCDATRTDGGSWIDRGDRRARFRRQLPRALRVDAVPASRRPPMAERLT